MAIVKSFSFPDRNTDIRGDMFYIKHNNGTFSVIDCYLKKEGTPNGRMSEIIQEIKVQSSGQISRFISTHPDQDHIAGLEVLDKQWPIVNFYSVPNEVPQDKGNLSLMKYIELHDDTKINYSIQRDINRAWLNSPQDGRSGAGINFLWPVLDNEKFLEAQQNVAKGVNEKNDICPIFTYSVKNSATIMWMGDLETEMQEEFYAQFRGYIPHVDILFQPHHGRETGSVPEELLKALNPTLIIIGNAPAKHIDYGDSRYTITQNTSGDLVFVLDGKNVHIYSQHTIPNKPACLKYNWDYAFENNFQNMVVLGCGYRGTLTINN